MKLQTIDKSRYRKHLNRLIIACGGALLILSLGISTLLIELFGSQQSSNFYLNLAGVVLAAVIILLLLINYQRHDAMHEINYVWRLKQELNRINRKLTTLEQAALNNDKNAMIVLNFSNQGSKQLWQLDDNTITLDILNRKTEQLAQQLADNGFVVTTKDYCPALLSAF